jgi:hypothetical protein
MANLSYSPQYHQSVIWVAEYNDGSILREWDDSGKECPFKDINKDKLRKFHLISADSDSFFDCQTGVFTVNDKQYVFLLAGEGLAYAEGLIHYKDAATEFVNEKLKRNLYDNFEIVGYEMGWKVVKDNVKSQVVLHLPSKVFEVQVTFLDLQKTIKWNFKV